MSTTLEQYFSSFKTHIVGNSEKILTPYGEKELLYADWVASGRLYKPIEDLMLKKIGPMIGNTHSESSETGVFMTKTYNYARKIIKKHVNATSDDILICAGSGMTRVVNKFQRILGLKLPDKHSYFNLSTGRTIDHYNNLGDDKPVVFVTHVEHHSNHFSWVETIADVVLIPPCNDLKVCADELKKLLEKYKTRRIKIGAFSGGSNVTGCSPSIHEFARIMHEYGGLCFIDYAASAPYIDINMHPGNDPRGYLDAIYFSPHKFLGGPGSTGVLIFNKKLYHNISPDNPGGGTVLWTNPWNEVKYYEEIEMREDGGTPPFLQTIRAALSIKLKEKMGVENIIQREKELLKIAFEEFAKIKGLHILASNITDRIGVFTFYSEIVHHNLLIKLLNDRYGIQARGGCSCAGPYGHFLFHIDKNMSHLFTDKIEAGDATLKPGWVRISLHPTLSDNELRYIIKATDEITKNIKKWQKDYFMDIETSEWYHKNFIFDENKVKNAFKI